MNKDEENLKKPNLKDRVKNFGKILNKNWLWVNFGAYISGLIIILFLFFLKFIDFVEFIIGIFVIIVLPPIIIPLVYYGRKSIHQKTISKIILVGCGGFGFGVFFWLFLGYIFIAAPWALLRGLDPVLRGRIFLFLLFGSWGFMSYVMYRIGKKRDWTPPPIY
jgi:hypothetical protein